LFIIGVFKKREHINHRLMMILRGYRRVKVLQTFMLHLISRTVDVLKIILSRQEWLPAVYNLQNQVGPKSISKANEAAEKHYIRRNIEICIIIY